MHSQAAEMQKLWPQALMPSTRACTLPLMLVLVPNEPSGGISTSLFFIYHTGISAIQRHYSSSDTKSRHPLCWGFGRQFFDDNLDNFDNTFIPVVWWLRSATQYLHKWWIQINQTKIKMIGDTRSRREIIMYLRPLQGLLFTVTDEDIFCASSNHLDLLRRVSIVFQNFISK